MKDTIENRTAIRAEIQAMRERLAEIAHELDHIDHDAARELHKARDAMHEGWAILRQPPLEETAPEPIRASYEDEDWYTDPNSVASYHHY